MGSSVFGILVRFLTMIFPWIMRWLIKPNKIQSNINIDVSSMQDSFMIDLSAQRADVWLTISNHNDFPIVFDRLELNIHIGHASSTLRKIIPDEKSRIAPNSTGKLFVRDYITSQCARALSEEKNVEYKRMDIKVYLITDLHNFSFEIFKDQIANVKIL